MTLAGKGIIITGGSRGLGRAIAHACLSEGAHILISGRDGAALDEACKGLIRARSECQEVVTFQGDVSKPTDVTELIAVARRGLPALDGLVNNAGVYGPMGRLEETDPDEWRRAVDINLIGPMLTCRAVVPIFRHQKHGKIVNISGGGATQPLPGISAYAASKAALVRLTETLAYETRADGICVNAVAPGAMNTRFLDEVLEAGPDKVGQAYYDRATEQKRTGGVAPKTGADLVAFLLSNAANGITGRLISAVWDQWRNLTMRAAELGESDVYTLRRIVPSDRNKNWGELCR